MRSHDGIWLGHFPGYDMCIQMGRFDLYDNLKKEVIDRKNNSYLGSWTRVFHSLNQSQYQLGLQREYRNRV